MSGCKQTEVYEAIVVGSEDRCFLDLSSDGLELTDDTNERPRFVIGRVVERGVCEAELYPENETTDYGLAVGTAYICVKLADITRFT